jgi:O-acetyl-ADP-ribose deacetylase (regulator of RNase III)
VPRLRISVSSEERRTAMKSRIELVKGDLTAMDVDAIVNPANNSALLGGKGVDGAIHSAAGPDLAEECRPLGGCETGDAKITSGHRLKARHVIHTVAPLYQDGKSGEPQLLESCYRRIFELAHENGLKSIAFPSVGTGFFKYPIEEASKIAIATILEQLKMYPDIKKVFFVVFSDSDLEVYRNNLGSL